MTGDPRPTDGSWYRDLLADAERAGRSAGLTGAEVEHLREILGRVRTVRLEAEQHDAEARLRMREAEHRAGEYLRALRDYRSLMLHRINNPLQIIFGAAQTMADYPDMDVEARAKLLGAILDAARRLELVTVDPEPVDGPERELHPEPFEAT